MIKEDWCATNPEVKMKKKTKTKNKKQGQGQMGKEGSNLRGNMGKCSWEGEGGCRDEFGGMKDEIVGRGSEDGWTKGQ